MIQFELKINAINCNTTEGDLTNVVKSINFEYVATEGEHTVREFRQQEVPSPNPETFISTDELTKETVENWLLTILNKKEPTKDHLRAQGILEISPLERMQRMLTTRMENLKNPPEPKTKNIFFSELK